MTFHFWCLDCQGYFSISISCSSLMFHYSPCPWSANRFRSLLTPSSPFDPWPPAVCSAHFHRGYVTRWLNSPQSEPDMFFSKTAPFSQQNVPYRLFYLFIALLCLNWGRITKFAVRPNTSIKKQDDLSIWLNVIPGDKTNCTVRKKKNTYISTHLDTVSP